MNASWKRPSITREAPEPALWRHTRSTLKPDRRSRRAPSSRASSAPSSPQASTRSHGHVPTSRSCPSPSSNHDARQNIRGLPRTPRSCEYRTSCARTSEGEYVAALDHLHSVRLRVGRPRVDARDRRDGSHRSDETHAHAVPGPRGRVGGASRVDGVPHAARHGHRAVMDRRRRGPAVPRRRRRPAHDLLLRARASLLHLAVLAHAPGPPPPDLGRSCTRYGSSRCWRCCGPISAGCSCPSRSTASCWAPRPPAPRGATRSSRGGGGFFLFADSVLAFELFRPEALPAWSSPLVMATYCLGQGLFAAGVIVTMHERRVAAAAPDTAEVAA